MSDDTDNDKKAYAPERLVSLVQQEYSSHPCTFKHLTFSSEDIDVDAVAFALTDLGFALEEDKFYHESMPILIIDDSNVAANVVRHLAESFSALDGLCYELVAVHKVKEIDVSAIDAIDSALSELNYKIREGEFYRSGQKGDVAGVAREVVEKLFLALSSSGLAHVNLEGSQVFDPSVGGSPQPDTASQREGLQAAVDGADTRAAEKQLAHAPVGGARVIVPEGDINQGILAAVGAPGQNAETPVVSEATTRQMAVSPDAGVDTGMVTQQMRPGTEYIPPTEGNGAPQLKDSVPGLGTLVAQRQSELAVADELAATGAPASEDSVVIPQPSSSPQSYQRGREVGRPLRAGHRRVGTERKEIDLQKLAEEGQRRVNEGTALKNEYETKLSELKAYGLRLEGWKAANDEHVAQREAAANSSVARARKKTDRYSLLSGVLLAGAAVLGVYASETYEARKDLEGKLGKAQTASYNAGHQAGRKEVERRLKELVPGVQSSADEKVYCEDGTEGTLIDCVNKSYRRIEGERNQAKQNYANHCGTYDEQSNTCSKCGDDDTQKITALEEQNRKSNAQFNKCTSENEQLKNRPESCPEQRCETLAPQCEPPKSPYIRQR